MLKAMGVILICLSGLPAFCQSASEYRVGTITAVAPHQAAAASNSSVASYDVSVRVENTVYVILYTPPLGNDTVRYVAGRELLIMVGEKTAKFSDELGNSHEVSILSRTPVAPQTTARDLPPPQTPQPPQAPIKGVELVGLAGVKDNTGGTLTVEGGKLIFVHSRSTSDITASAMEDVVTGNDSQRVVRGTLGTLSMFGPYGSGRVLSLFRSKLDTLTIQYRDADGGLHGVVFTVPVGKAESFKQELIAQGARTTIPTTAEPSVSSTKPVAAETKQ